MSGCRVALTSLSFFPLGWLKIKAVSLSPDRISPQKPDGQGMSGYSHDPTLGQELPLRCGMVRWCLKG